jgi:NitT/TauT family transport system permease protein
MTARVWPRRSAKAPAPRRVGPPVASSRRRDALLFLAFVVVLAVVWELAVTWFKVNAAIIAKPSAIVHSLWVGLTAAPSSRASFFPHIAATLNEVVAGYLLGSLIGLLLAIGTVRFRLFEILIRPLAVSFQSIPKIALAPLFLIWFGFGFNSKFALVTIATFFPVFINGIAGFRSVDLGLIRMMRSFQASPWQIFSKVQFKSALPYIFAGMEIGIVHGVTSAVGAELLGGQIGIGVRIIESEQTLDVASIFAELTLLAVMGGVLYGVIAQLRKRVVTWTGERLLYVDQ